MAGRRSLRKLQFWREGTAGTTSSATYIFRGIGTILDNIKIDRSFIKDIPRNSDDATITRTIIDMTHNLRLKVVAEGVETTEQLDFLRVHGCDEIQGYYFSRPLAEDGFLALVQAREGKAAIAA